MSVISLKKANCKNCYKCVRVCPVKSILIKDQQAEIIPHDCILCGRCLEACPQNAKVITSDIDKVKGFIASDKRVIVSLAPAFLGSFQFEKRSTVVKTGEEQACSITKKTMSTLPKGIVLSSILCNGDCQGAVILADNSGQKETLGLLKALSATAANFLGKNMEQ